MGAKPVSVCKLWSTPLVLSIACAHIPKGTDWSEGRAHISTGLPFLLKVNFSGYFIIKRLMPSPVIVKIHVLFNSIPKLSNAIKCI